MILLDRSVLDITSLLLFWLLLDKQQNEKIMLGG